MIDDILQILQMTTPSPTQLLENRSLPIICAKKIIHKSVTHSDTVHSIWSWFNFRQQSHHTEMFLNNNRVVKKKKRRRKKRREKKRRNISNKTSMEFSNRQLQTLIVINTKMSEAWDYWCTTFFVLFFSSLSAFFKNNLTWRWQLHIHNIVSQFYPLTRSFTFRQHHSVDDIMYSKSICKKGLLPCVARYPPLCAKLYYQCTEYKHVFLCLWVWAQSSVLHNHNVPDPATFCKV